MSRVVDALVLAWVLGWLLLGIAVGREVRDFADISDNARQAGLTTQRAADVLDDVPLIGDAPAKTLRDVGTETIRSAERTRERIRELGTRLGLIIAIVPSLPLLIFFLPGRLALARDRSAVKTASDELLAARAVVHIPLHRLQAITPDPMGDLREGRYAALADAERRRVNVARAR